ncbi:MAG: YggS family pyridoxal phosphate-dependent enzyme [Actinomycetota bacterium]|nr:YggS family pyridoxal phosphate-dependent enzyme [Actinomycetota bacterium]
MTVAVPDVAERLAAVRARIAATGRPPEEVAVVAVTKGFRADAIGAAAAAGILDVGENYAQELVAKAQAGRADDRLRWHFLGHVQRNKVKTIAPVVHLWQGVDRVAAGEEIARRAPGARVLVQVRVDGGDDGEAKRNGCEPHEVPALVERLDALGLDVRGLMAVGPVGPPELARPGFAAVRALAERLGLVELSMGMTDDLEVAVEEGSTMVRVGRGLFGARPVAAGTRR